MMLQARGALLYNLAPSHAIRHPRLVYWAGGNPFHHHQTSPLRLAWRKPETVVFHEQFWRPAAKMSDIVLTRYHRPGA